MAEDKYTVTKNGMKMTKTYEDGTSITVPNPDYNPEPNWGVTVPKSKATSKPKPKPKGTQAGHAVTDSKNNTKPLTPAQKQAQAKRPAVGNDKAAAKNNKNSWNNGYTN